ncbi:histidine kinase [Rhodopirellula sp. SWK7]|nr:histidine kinase [Rhodopirellula sp. SWK7]
MEGTLRTIISLILCTGMLAFTVTEHATPTDGWRRLSLSALEQRLADVNGTLLELPSLSLRGGAGAIGFRSVSYDEPDNRVWIEIQFGSTELIDQIVLVPTIWRDAKNGFVADGFPRQFDILIGTDEDAVGTVVARIKADDAILPRVAPLVIDLPKPVAGSWIRVDTNVLSRRVWDGRFDLQLAEIIVFSGEENVALHRNVSVSEDAYTTVKSLQKDYLVDGFLPYLMDASEGTQSIAYLCSVESGQECEITFDLKTTFPIDRIHLHGPDISDTVPQSQPAEYGVPRNVKAYGSDSRDFEDAKLLCEFSLATVYDIAPIMVQRFPPFDCRYVRLVASDSARNASEQEDISYIGFAEIELFANGTNVAEGAELEVSGIRQTSGRKLSAVTDGSNFYGSILPTRAWLEGLAKRHDLETLRPQITNELQQRYAQQTANLRRMTWLAVFLVVAIGFTVLLTQMIQMRQLAEIKERFAADLHDELGANLHTIGLLSDLADDAKESPNDLSTFLQRIRSVTERTGVAMRHCTDMQDASELYAGFRTDMQRTAERIAVHIDHDLVVSGETHLNRLKPRIRFDLFLFYKECLVNICRHSGATQLATRLVADASEVKLSISDNGRGLSGSSVNAVPPSLHRRAKLLGADIKVDCPPTGGTCVQLTLRPNRWRFRR